MRLSEIQLKMGRTWVLTVVVVTVLELLGVMGYVPEPLPTYSPVPQRTRRPAPLSTHTPKPQRTYRPTPLPNHTRKPLRPRMSQPSGRDESAIYFPESEHVDNSRQHTGSKRSLSDTGNAPARFSDIYPQTQFFNAERQQARDDQPAAHGPQNPWRNPQPQWGNSGVNNSPRRPQNRPNAFPTYDDYEEPPFVFDRPPANGGVNRPQPGNGGVNRPRPGNNAGVNRPQPGNGGVNRPQPGNGGANRPRPGNNAGVNRPQPGNNGGSARPRPITRPPAPATPATTTPRATAAPTTTRRPPGAPVTMPTPAPTRAGCNCPSTPEFNPVCGQDRVTYTNPGKLRCANACGNRVMMLHFGSCVTTTTPAPSG